MLFGQRSVIAVALGLFLGFASGLANSAELAPKNGKCSKGVKWYVSYKLRSGGFDSILVCAPSVAGDAATATVPGYFFPLDPDDIAKTIRALRKEDVALVYVTRQAD